MRLASWLRKQFIRIPGEKNKLYFAPLMLAVHSAKEKKILFQIDFQVIVEEQSFLTIFAGCFLKKILI